MNVPLLDLVAQYRAIKDEVWPALEAVIESQLFIMGAPVAELERAVAELAGARHGIACASGTDALLLPLKALALRPGDEVITTPFTFFATAGAIHNAGGTPVFVDIEPDTFNIAPAAVAAAVAPRTRAILPVHLYGQMAAMERLLPIAEAHGLPVLEDAAQAIGARRRVAGAWRRAGELGWAAGFSFFPSKNLGAWGDGGMMVTSDDALAERLRRLRLHGGAKQYHHEEVGTNSRLDSLQAAVLLATPPTTRRAWPSCPRCARPGWIPPTSTSSISTPCGWSGATRCRRTSRRGGWRRRCTTPSPCTSSPVSGTSATGRGSSPRRSGRRARCCRCPCTPSSPGRSRIT